MPSVERCFAPDHPAAQGHFPGNPIIPGAVVLGEALQAIETALGLNLSPCQMKAAKFFSPTRPGDRVVIDFTRSTQGQIKFVCSVAGKTVLTAEITCDAIQKPT